MNTTEFKKEIIDYINNSYDEFIEYRNIVKNILREFHKICVNNDFTYYYAFGSLLGAIRDGDLIPWDADIDVLISINDARKIIKTLVEELPNDLYVVSNFIDKNYYLCETRICSKKYDSDIVHLDIFYLIGTPQQEGKRIRFVKKIKKVFYKRALRFQKIDKGNTKKDALAYYAKKTARFFQKIKPNWIFRKECNKILFKYDFSASSYYACWGGGAEVFPASIFSPAITRTVGDMEAMFPNNPEEFLKIRYGNYTDYMPVSKRFEEFYDGFKNFKNSFKD